MIDRFIDLRIGILIVLVQTYGPVTQSKFLKALGIETRYKVCACFGVLIEGSHWN